MAPSKKATFLNLSLFRTPSFSRSRKWCSSGGNNADFEISRFRDVQKRSFSKQCFFRDPGISRKKYQVANRGSPAGPGKKVGQTLLLLIFYAREPFGFRKKSRPAAGVGPGSRVRGQDFAVERLGRLPQNIAKILPVFTHFWILGKKSGDFLRFFRGKPKEILKKSSEK